MNIFAKQSMYYEMMHRYVRDLPKFYVSRSTSELRLRLVLLNMFKPSCIFSGRSKAVLLLWILLLFMFHVCPCYAVLSFPCNLVITPWDRTDFLFLLCVMFSCVFATFPYCVPGQVWYLIVSIPDLCLLLYF